MRRDGFIGPGELIWVQGWFAISLRIVSGGLEDDDRKNQRTQGGALEK
jgi:hypothetical protein